MDQNNIDNLNQLTRQIYDNEKLTKNNGSKRIEKLRKHKIILFLFILLFLISSIWLYFFRKPEVRIIESKIDEAFTLVRKDSLKNYKTYYFNKNLGNNKVALDNEKIIMCNLVLLSILNCLKQTLLSSLKKMT